MPSRRERVGCSGTSKSANHRTISASSPVPLVVQDKVLVGIAGGDFPSRGFIDAYQAETGERAWRFYTVPDKGEPNANTWSGNSYETGGGGAWGVGSYDPELDLVYWGVGQPYPDYDGDAREGDNLYTDSVVALDPNTGALRWHFQYTPHDMWDWDGINELVFAELERDGRRVKALLHADRNGHFYALDRETGQFLYAEPFVRATWNKGFDGKGRPIFDPAAYPTYEGVEVCPGAAGGKEWNAMAHDPGRGLVFVPAIENCAVFTNYGVKAKAQGREPGPSGFRYLAGEAYGKVMAIHADTGKTAWEVKLRTPAGAGVLATASGLAFTGDAGGQPACLRFGHRRRIVVVPDRLGHPRRTGHLPARRRSVHRNCGGHGRSGRRLYWSRRPVDGQSSRRGRSVRVSTV